jgi:hypothetical protein
LALVLLGVLLVTIQYSHQLQQLVVVREKNHTLGAMLDKAVVLVVEQY